MKLLLCFSGFSCWRLIDIVYFSVFKYCVTLNIFSQLIFISQYLEKSTDESYRNVFAQNSRTRHLKRRINKMISLGAVQNYINKKRRNKLTEIKKLTLIVTIASQQGLNYFQYRSIYFSLKSN